MVTKSSDTGVAGDGSLRGEIAAANSGDTINFNIPKSDPGYNASTGAWTITLTRGELDITENLTINGPGAGVLSISGNDSSRVFGVASGSVVLSDLTITQGFTTDPNGGGGILATGGNLTLTNCVISNCQAQPDPIFQSTNGGGAIVVNGANATLTDCVISNCQATQGGAIRAFGNTQHTVQIDSCSFLGNTASGSGGALDSPGSTVIINASTFSQNSAPSGGAISYGTGGSCTLTNDTFTGNKATGGNGGAINFNAGGTCTLLNDTIDGNTAATGGGGIEFPAGGTFTMTNTIVANNKVEGSGGGIQNFGSLQLIACTVTNNTALSDNSAVTGGGIYNGGTLTVLDSTISGNTAGLNVFPPALFAGNGGGIGSFGQLTIKASTLVGNQVNNDGGAIDIEGGSAQLTNVTITGNRADSDNFEGGSGGGIFTGDVLGVLLNNTIVAGNTGTAGIADDVSGALDPASAFNILGTLAGLNLGTLANNGGPTQTVALLPGSIAAIDTGSTARANQAGLTADQRGYPYENAVDIGAYEFHEPTHVVFVPGTPGNTIAGDSVPVTVLIEDANNDVVTTDDSAVTVTLSGPGTFADGTTTAQITAVNGVATFNALVIDRAGNYTLQASDGKLGASPAASFTVTGGAATTLAVSFPSPTTAGVVQNFTVTAEDRFGNVAPDFAGTVTFISTDPQAVLPGSVTISGGVVTVSGAFRTAGQQTLTATAVFGTAGQQTLVSSFSSAPSLTGSVTVEVEPAAATQFVVTGVPAVVNAGTAFSVTVTAFDPFGNIDTNFNGVVAVTSNDSAANLPSSVALTSGTATFQVFFPSGGQQKTVTITAGANPSLTATASLNVNSLIFPVGVVTVQQVLVPFTATVATFTTAFDAVPSDFTAEISWGDHTFSAGTVIATGPNSFQVQGSHEYSTITTFLVDVVIGAAARRTQEQSAPSATVVLNFGQDAALADYGFQRTAPGAKSATESATGITADLEDPQNADRVMTLFVARYSGNPESPGVNGAAFFDVRATGTDAGAFVTVTFFVGDLSGFNGHLLYFNSATGTYDPVLDAQGNPITAQRTAGSAFVTFTFAGDTLPQIFQLTDTVFTIAVNPDVPPPAAALVFVSFALATGSGGPGSAGGGEVANAAFNSLPPGTGVARGADGGGTESDGSPSRSALADLPEAPGLSDVAERRLIVSPSQSSATVLTEDDDQPPPNPNQTPEEEPEAFLPLPALPPHASRQAAADAHFAAAVREKDPWGFDRRALDAPEMPLATTETPSPAPGAVPEPHRPLDTIFTETPAAPPVVGGPYWSGSLSERLLGGVALLLGAEHAGRLVSRRRSRGPQRIDDPRSVD
jgi:hypothetical protein